MTKLKPCSCDRCKGALARIYKNVTEDGERKQYCQQGYFRAYPKKPIAKESARRKKERPIYTKNKSKALEERPYCELKIPGVCTGKAQGMQHKKGRTGKLYLDLNYLGTSCNACNGWCVSHPKEAVALKAAVWRNRIESAESNAD